MTVAHVRFSPEADEALELVVEGVRDSIMRHPIATQAAFAALVAEGKRFAESERGKLLAEQLARSELVARLRVVWESLSMTAFVEQPDVPLPSFFLDGVVRAAAEQGLESLLSRAFDELP
jgi:hypothetical protein